MNELEAWVAAEFNGGTERVEIERSLTQLGWHPGSAREVLDRVTGTSTRSPCQRRVGHPMPGRDLVRLLRSPQIGDREVHLRMFVRHPAIALFDHFLSAAECEELIGLVAPRLKPSRIADVERAGRDGLATYSRTSDSVVLDDAVPEIAKIIERRAASLLDWHVERFEYMQVVRYRPGEEFAPHHDYFDMAFPGSSSLIRDGGHRVGSLLLYLSDVEEGGSTIFTDIQLEVLPRRGSALFFSYDVPHPLTLTEHGGAPVIRGEKWLATLFIRQDRHRRNHDQ